MQPTIAIIGGGPAGCAAALTLRRYLPHLPVTLVTRASTGLATGVGETLSPGVLPLLEYLGLRQAFVGKGHLPCGGTASAWGSAQVQQRDYLFTGRGHGWHLDRVAFDAWLMEQAQQMGAHCVQARAQNVSHSDGTWNIALDGGDSLQATAIVEVTGRTARLLQQESERPQRHDSLVADARWFRHARHEASAEGALVESCPDGWWYSASLPGQRGVAMFMTDQDLRAQASWEERLAAAPTTRSRLADWETTGESAIRAAHSQCAQNAAGAGWVVAGDAAAAFDPISSMGIGFALRSGMEAARVAVAAMDGDTDHAAHYAASVARIYAEYRGRLRAIYASEKRWAEQPFWARRR